MGEKTLAQPVNPDKQGKKKTTFEKYEVEDAVSTLLRAQEIQANKPLMAEVHKKLEGKRKAITSIQGLKERRTELEEEEKA
jgi:hypothetical protein